MKLTMVPSLIFACDSSSTCATLLANCGAGDAAGAEATGAVEFTTEISDDCVSFWACALPARKAATPTVTNHF